MFSIYKIIPPSTQWKLERLGNLVRGIECFVGLSVGDPAFIVCMSPVWQAGYNLGSRTYLPCLGLNTQPIWLHTSCMFLLIPELQSAISPDIRGVSGRNRTTEPLHVNQSPSTKARSAQTIKFLVELPVKKLFSKRSADINLAGKIIVRLFSI